MDKEQELLTRKYRLEHLDLAIKALATINISELHALLDTGSLELVLRFLKARTPNLFCRLASVIEEVKNS
jgi:hypothetical protein